MAQQQQNTIDKATMSEGEKVPDIQALASRMQSLNQSVEWWNAAIIWALIFAAFAAIAVVVTTRIALMRAKQLADTQAELIQAKDNQLASDLKDKDLKIAEAGEKAAKATERAAQAELELAKFKQPRTLTQEQQERIVFKLKAFPSQRFAAYVFSDQEAIDLANTIGHILDRAQWVVQRPDSDIAIGKLGMSVLTGVWVEIAPSRAEKLRAAAERLSSALSAEGILCKTVEALQREKSPDTIHIVIGKKPM